MRLRVSLLVFLLGSMATGATTAAADGGDPVRGEMLFRACKACHTVAAAGGTTVGPPLHGVFGRKAGTVNGYNYSKALENAEIVWSEETISKLFALGPDVFTPGSKMPLQAMTKAKDRADLIAYLKIVTAQKSSDGTGSGD